MRKLSGRSDVALLSKTYLLIISISCFTNYFVFFAPNIIWLWMHDHKIVLQRKFESNLEIMINTPFSSFNSWQIFAKLVLATAKRTSRSLLVLAMFSFQMKPLSDGLIAVTRMHTARADLRAWLQDYYHYYYQWEEEGNLILLALNENETQQGKYQYTQSKLHNEHITKIP